MAKQFPPFSFSKLMKKSSITGLIVLLAWTLYHLTDNFNLTQHTKLPASNSPVELYSNQTKDDLTHLYTEAIGSAKQSIILSIYALLDRHIIQSLKKKSEEGIPIYIVSDAKASPGITRSLPKATIVRRFSEGLMHQKILIVDHKHIWLGSANLTTSSLKVHGNLVIGMENRAIAEALTTRIKSMDEDGGVSSPLLHQESTAGPQQVELWVLPDDPRAVKRMISLFRSATKTIKVAMFTWTRIDFIQELIHAAKRGVDVSIVIDRYSGKGASAKIVRMGEEAGISIRFSTCQGLLHHKFAYIDDRILINGSANWTHAAFKSNDDYFVIIDPLTTEQQGKMNELWSIIERESTQPGISPPSSAKKNCTNTGPIYRNDD